MIEWYLCCPAFVASLALAAAWPSLAAGRMWRGWLIGMTVITATGGAAIFWVVRACLSCPETELLCCEWTGVGVMLYVLGALLSALVFTPIALFIGLRARRATPPPPGESWPARAKVGVLLAAAAGCLVAWGVSEVLSRGLLAPWKNIGRPPGVVTEMWVTDYDDLWVRLEDGRVYTRSVLCPIAGTNGPSPRCWYMADSIRTSPAAQDVCSLLAYVPPPPGPPVRSADAAHCRPGYESRVRYVQLVGGDFWVWRQTATRYGQRAYFALAVAPCVLAAWWAYLALRRGGVRG